MGRIAFVGCVAAAVSFGGFMQSTRPIRAADMKYPLSSAVAKDGTIYVADRNLPGIWKVAGGKAQVFFQASKKFRTPLNAVWCVTFDSKGRLLAGDSATRDVYRFSKDGKPTPLTKGAIGIPIAMATDGKGTLYVSDLETQRIWKLSEEGGKTTEFAVLAGPRGLTVDPAGNVWSVNSGKDQLVRFDAKGKREAVVKGRPFKFAHCVAVAEDGTAYVTDGYGKCIWKVPPGKPPEKLVAGAPLVNPVGLTWNKGKLLVTDSRANAVFEITTAGKVTKIVGGAAPKKK
ncbi:MAG: NHL repeat-containing protein [Planctomycetaceae bacterium]